MPLRAKINDSDVLAFDYSNESWEELKNSQKRTQLTMPCCGGKAIPKTSPLGTFFFAHYRKPENCYSQPESKQHILLKSVVAKAAKSIDWDVVTEYSEISPRGEKWIADVFCKRERARIALEVQLSKQGLNEFLRRQMRYKESGVRTAWFVSEKVEKAISNNINYMVSKDLPVFVVTEFEVINPIPIVRDFNMPLESFVRSLLSGYVSWKTDKDELSVEFLEDRCWSCGSHVKQPCGYFDDVYGCYIKSVPNCSRVLKEIRDYVGNENLANYGINLISEHPEFNDNTPDFPYCAECLNCGNPQSNYYLWEKFKVARKKEELQTETFIVGECNGRWVVGQ